jgi:hypothetical protein
MATLRIPLAISGLVVLLSVSACGQGAKPPGDQEPPLVLYFESHGRRIPIELDKPFGVEALSGMKTATLRTEPYRVFPYAGLSFRYPRTYTFAASFETQGASIWTLKGGKFLIMVQHYPGVRDHAAIRERVKNAMLKRYANAKTRELDAKLKLNGATVNGRRIEVTLAVTPLHQDLFSFSVGEGSVVLMLQDTPDRDGRPSADRIVAETMLQESLRLPSQ